MNFSLPVNEEQTRIKVVKKEDMASRKEAKSSVFAKTSPAVEAEVVPPAGTPATGTAAPTNFPITATVVPVSKHTQPKVQLVEVEPGIYDVYFTCSCCEQYVIRCESLEKAAEASPAAS